MFRGPELRVGANTQSSLVEDDANRKNSEVIGTRRGIRRQLQFVACGGSGRGSREVKARGAESYNALVVQGGLGAMRTRVVVDGKEVSAKMGWRD